MNAQSRLRSDSSFSGRRSMRAHTGRSAAQRVRRKAGKDMGFGVKSGSNALWVSASSYQIGSLAGGVNGLQAPPHGRREVRSYTANRRELRFGVVAAKAVAGRLIMMAPGVCVRSMGALIRTAQSNRLSYCQRCGLYSQR